MQDQGYKTLGVRLDNATHAQLSALAQIGDTTLTDLIQQAIAEFLEAKRRDPAMAAKAQALLAEFDRDVQARRGAIAGMFGELAEGVSVQPPPSGRKSSRGEQA